MARKRKKFDNQRLIVMYHYVPVDLEIRGHVRKSFFLQRFLYIFGSIRAIRGFLIFCVIFHISGCILLSEKSRCNFHIIEAKNHNNDSVINVVRVTIDSQVRGHALFCMTYNVEIATENFLITCIQTEIRKVTINGP